MVNEMKKVAIIAGVLGLLLFGLALYMKADKPAIPINAILEDEVLGVEVKQAYPVLRREGYELMDQEKWPGYWKRDADSVKLKVETRQQDGKEMVSVVTITP